MIKLDALVDVYIKSAKRSLRLYEAELARIEEILEPLEGTNE